MKICENGIYREASAKEAAELGSYTSKPTPYKERVVNRIREVYSVDDELALLRQRVLKADEFAEYNSFVERIKEEERDV